jgi:hypothetical protein
MHWRQVAGKWFVKESASLKFLSNEVELSSYYQCDIEK